ncbi:MAG: Gfo/Idh/MocA family oxidoreductase [Patescibacteria group bacterium]
MSKQLSIAIIGAGYWGKNLIRVFNAVPDARIAAVCDANEKRLVPVRAQHPHILVTKSADDLFSDRSIQAVLIATPPATHFDLARRALDAGKHVWIEKPMTETVADAEELARLARVKKHILLVDHTFLYTAAVRKMKELIERGELGAIRYLDSERINLGLIQPDVNVIYDLAAHDISIFNHLLGYAPVAVHAIGASHVTKKSVNPREELAYVGLRYPNDIMAQIRVSWLSPVKIRKMLIGGSKKMIIYDDIEPTEKIRVYDHGVEIDFEKDTATDPTYRSGDVLIPHIENNEALLDEAKHFVSCIREKKQPLTDAANGIAVMKALEAANVSLKRNGEMVAIA